MPMKMRTASAMIELIFALVIMGLVLMSAPTLISTATKSSFIGLQQEAITEAASHMNMILGYHWDEGDTNEEYLDPILIVSGTADANLSVYKLNSWRIGTPKESSRSIVREDGVKNITATTPANLGMDAGEPPEDDVDDFIGSYTLTSVAAAGKSDVADKQISVATTVSYALDSPDAAEGPYDTTGGNGIISFSGLTDTAAGSTNIKHVTVTLTSTSGVSEYSKKIVLQAFVCNIGAYKLESKAF